MSVRSNGAGDKLALTADNLGLGTTDWNIGGWHKRSADRDAVSQLCFIGTTADPTTAGSPSLLFLTDADGTTLHMDFIGVGQLTAGIAIPAGWNYFVFRRSGNDLILTIFDDSTSTAPVASETVSGAATDGDWSNMENFILGAANAADWIDGEFESWRIHEATAWSSAQARAESQSYDPVTGGGTVEGNWKLKDTDGDADGLNDSSGQGGHLTNTGCVNGASTPLQLTPVTTHLPPSPAKRAGHQTMVAI